MLGLGEDNTISSNENLYMYIQFLFIAVMRMIKILDHTYVYINILINIFTCENRGVLPAGEWTGT